jgi:glycosyltransferase involved in cell wall biosynthesis
MKVLYVAFHDPMDIDVGNGMDYFHYHSICDRGFEVKVNGPFYNPAARLEQLIARIYQRTGKRYLKYKFTTAWKESWATNQAVRMWKPDVIFTIYPAALMFYKESTPCVYSLDTTIYGLEKFWPLYGWPILMLSMWQEQRVINKCKKVLTNSEWHRKILTDIYKVPLNRTEVFALPSTLPPHQVPNKIEMGWKTLQSPFRLLLVGRDYLRKGIDIAIETVRKLNSAGIFAELTVCGIQGKEERFVKFVGPYKKSDSGQLVQYLDLYRKANLLIHPALFEPAGIVAAEAAAFGTPTITNDVGGMATTVADGESGFVLPAGSPSDAYVQTITRLIQNPEGYYALCQRTRRRYERELNWDVVGTRFADILRQAAKPG